MRWLRRANRTCLACCAILSLAYIGSIKYYAFYSPVITTESWRSVGVGRGLIMIWWGRNLFGWESTWRYGDATRLPYGFGWKPVLDRSMGLTQIYIPIWAPMLVVAAGAGGTWRLERRRRNGHCRKCGYDAGGLDRCPECGVPAGE
jgi:hypothetical protein